MAKKSSASRKPAQAAMRRKKPARGGKSQMAAPAAVAVTKEQRGHLIEDIAYFHADRFRAVGPGGFREEDRQAAETEIESLLEKKRK